MNALRLITVTVTLAILMGCAGAERKCIINAMDAHWEKRAKLEKAHSQPKVSEACEELFQDIGFVYYQCETTEMDDFEYATRIDWQALALRFQIRNCLQ